MLIAMLIGMVGLTQPASAAFEISDAKFFYHARPLIDAFLGEQRTKFDFKFAPVEGTWGIKNYIYRSHAWALPFFNGGRWDSSCREVSVALADFEGRRAHFFVRVTFPENSIIARPPGQNPKYELVPTCNRLKVGLNKPEMQIDGVNKNRAFADAEVTELATPLLRAFLRSQGRPDDLDPRTVELRAKGVDAQKRSGFYSWAHLKFTRPNLVCRRLRVYLPREKMQLTAFVSIIFGRDDVVPYLPTETQTILNDRSSLRSYRISLVKGCDQDGFFEPAILRLKPVLAPPATPKLPTCGPENASVPSQGVGDGAKCTLHEGA